MSPQPRVSVVVPCYNHEQFVRETIESVWNQTYPNVELIVIDDASTDGSAAVIQAARAERQFVFLSNERNLGVNGSIERGLAHATGELVGLLGSDDLILPTKIADQVQWLLAHGMDGVFATGYLLRPDGRTEPISLDAAARRFQEGTALRHIYTSDTEGPLLQSGLFRTDMIRDLAGIRRQFKSDDWALAIRMLERHRIGFMNRPVFLYRQHAENSYRNYWRTFPMRVEVISLLTPEELRAEGLANLLESQASYLHADGHHAESRRFMAAALALDPSRRRIARAARGTVFRWLARIRDGLGFRRRG